jgi:hypothetical protein
MQRGIQGAHAESEPKQRAKGQRGGQEVLDQVVLVQAEGSQDLSRQVAAGLPDLPAEVALEVCRHRRQCQLDGRGEKDAKDEGPPSREQVGKSRGVPHGDGLGRRTQM